MTFPPLFKKIIGDKNYTINPVHRNGMPEKAQWTISYQDEMNSFIFSNQHAWICNDNAWGLHFINNHVAYLGVAQDHITEVFIAKFVNDVDHNNWHGYPADHQANQQDIPDENVLRDWLTNNIIPKQKINKIARGKPCKL